ncbi:response regulator aspartate phosphatase [Bacillus safensis]|uniref:response regulator aspartate phosphatase n=1 Tax=Bacillus safensis TaxID=561879 RepID=UPI00366D2478
MGGMIGYDVVALKVNDWYTEIKKGNVTDAEFLKKEIEGLIEEMEENQTVLLYYSLIEFRHQIMLSYLKPKIASPELLDMWEGIKDQKEKVDCDENEKNQMDHLIEFYFWYFKGVHYFREYRVDKAINCYKTAEKVLEKLEDDNEKTEFYFSLAEAYYHMDQQQISLIYANKALDILLNQRLMDEKIARCYSVIGGNFLSKRQFDEALKYFEKSNIYAKNTKNEYLIASTIFNLGKCYAEVKKYSDALANFDTAIDIFKTNQTAHIPKAYYNKFLTLLKMGELHSANQTYNIGIEFAKEANDERFATQMDYLYHLYFEANHPETINKLKSWLELLKSKDIYDDVSVLAIETARYYNESKQSDIAVGFYEIAIEAKEIIEGGELLNVKIKG